MKAACYLDVKSQTIETAALMASLDNDEAAVGELLNALNPTELALLEVGAERLAEAAYEKRQR